MGMIGRRFRRNGGVALGFVSVLALGTVLAARSADPFVADPAAADALRSATATQRALAEAQLVDLREALTAALDDGRTGAALTVQGTDRPGPWLEAAAQAISDADSLVRGALAELRKLAGDLAVAGTSSASILELQPGQLASIGGQLQTSAGAADAFWSMRQATATTLAKLGDAFAAVDNRDPTRALAAVNSAETNLAVVRQWPGSLQTLPIWTEATGELLAALKSLAVALRDGDVAGARAAEAKYRIAAAKAHRADLALALAIAEGGSDVSDNPLAAAASALRAVEDALIEVRSILA